MTHANLYITKKCEQRRMLSKGSPTANHYKLLGPIVQYESSKMTRSAILNVKWNLNWSVWFNRIRSPDQTSTQMWIVDTSMKVKNQFRCKSQLVSERIYIYSYRWNYCQHEFYVDYRWWFTWTWCTKHIFDGYLLFKRMQTLSHWGSNFDC